MMTPKRVLQVGGLMGAWAVVLIPLAWGVYQSVIKALPLFQAR